MPPQQPHKDKQQLVADHVALVHSIARKLRTQIAMRVDVDDLVGYGNKGLVEAAERFDPRHGTAFSTFAYYRIRGAMLDGVRTMGWYSRADYARYRAEERACEYMQREAARGGASRAADADLPAAAPSAPPGEDDGRTEAALSGIAELLGGLATIHITSIEAAAGIPDERLAPADAQLDLGLTGARTRQAIAKLPERERQLIEMYYFSDKNLEEAGAAMGLSKSWASRLHGRAIALLREALAAGDDKD